MSGARRFMGGFARVPVEAREFFAVHPGLKDAYARSVRDGSRLTVFLQGESGTAKQQLLWRLSEQGYATCQLPFVPFALDMCEHDAELAAARVSSVRAAWEKQLSQMVAAASASREGREGLLFVMRHVPVQLESPSAVVRLVADPIVVARRVAEKTFSQPDSPQSRLYKLLSHVEEEQLSVDAEINTTSVKQGVAALLKTVGVEAPTFPPR